MKTKQILIVLAVISGLLAVSSGRAQTAVASGNWSDPSTWNGDAVPATNALVLIDSPYTVTVDTNEAIVNIEGTGGLVMGTNVTLMIFGDAFEDYTGTLNASAPSNTIIIGGNPFNGIATGTTPGGEYMTNFDNLVLSPSGSGGLYPRVPLTVAGTLTLNGNIFVNGETLGAEGPAITLGNLVINTNAQFNCGGAPVTVTGNTIVNSPGNGTFGPGGLTDADGNTTTLDDRFGSITVTSNGVWNLGDVLEWCVNGNITNNGSIMFYGAGPNGSGVNQASITFSNLNYVVGDAFTNPVYVFDGTTIIETVMTATNAATISTNATLVFNLASPGEIVVVPTNVLYYAGNLAVINTGAAPVSGDSYQLFSASNYNPPYTFANITLPTLTSGLSWVTNLSVNGTISVTGSAQASIKITKFTYNPGTQQYTIVWSSAPSTSYSLRDTTTLNGTITWGTLATDISSMGTSTSYTFNNPGGKAEYFRISQP